MRRAHAMPFGAAVTDGGVRFRLWAPDAREVSLRLEGREPLELPLQPLGAGWYERVVPEAGPGARYRFRVDGGERLVPDPASRFQPEGVHGPSEVIDPGAFAWSDRGWRGRPWEEHVVEEIHVGAATAGGRFADLVERLEAIAAQGLTAIELMPVAAFPGARGWGYDGVYPFAPAACYGRPEQLKRLVDAAHARGLCVLLDVVYNHFGPEGNYLAAYASPFFTDRHATPWGAAIDFEGPHAAAVRAFFVENALYWVEEFGVDGLRLDAVHAIHDSSRPDVLTEIAAAVRARAGERAVHLVLENDRNEARRLRREGHGWYTAQWNDDAHHALHVLLTGEREGYYEDYASDPVAQLGRALAEGFAYQGEASPHRGGAPRGEPSAGLPPTAFVAFLQNHDQIGNRAFGDRLAGRVAPGALEAATAVLLLAPWIPLLFMGEAWGATEPFPFFCDFGGEIAAAVRDGRRREFASFAAFRDPAARARIPDPCAPETFAAARLDPARADAPPHAARRELVARLLAIRQAEVVPLLRGEGGCRACFGRLGPRALRVAWRFASGRLSLLANLGPDPAQVAVEAPHRVLFARPDGAPDALRRGSLPPWSVLWSATPA